MDVIKPILEQRLSKDTGSTANHDGPGPKTMIEWMIDNATPQQRSLLALASSQLAVAVAGVYTSSQAAAHLLLYLAAHPQYIDELRQEVTDHTSDINKINPNKLQKMEACMTETLRLNPPLMSKTQTCLLTQYITHHTRRCSTTTCNARHFLQRWPVHTEGRTCGFPLLASSVRPLELR